MGIVGRCCDGCFCGDSVDVPKVWVVVINIMGPSSCWRIYRNRSTEETRCEELERVFTRDGDAVGAIPLSFRPELDWLLASTTVY